jgi:hypothetical protein
MGKKIEKELKELNKRKEQAERAKANAVKAAKALPAIEKELAHTNWSISVLEKMRNIPDEIVSDDLLKAIEAENKVFRQIYAPLLENDFKSLPTVPTTYSSTASSFTLLNEVSNSEYYKKGGYTWAEGSKVEYESLLEKEHRNDNLIILLKLLNSTISKLFEDARKHLTNVINGLIQPKDYAFELRTIMDKVKGELKQAFLRGQKVKGNNILKAIGEATLKNDNSPFYELYQLKSEEFKRLKDNLSEMGKLRKVVNSSDMKSIFIEFADNLNIIMTLLSPYINAKR